MLVDYCRGVDEGREKAAKAATAAKAAAAAEFSGSATAGELEATGEEEATTPPIRSSATGAVAELELESPRTAADAVLPEPPLAPPAVRQVELLIEAMDAQGFTAYDRVTQQLDVCSTLPHASVVTQRLLAIRSVLVAHGARSTAGEEAEGGTGATGARATLYFTSAM